MCYIFSCFAWGLDFVQRLISFCLSCLLALTICCGLSVAVVSGIAYGYNYSMAEYITFTRSDVTVYMRRGSFSNVASLSAANTAPGGRRSGVSDEMAFNGTVNDYEDHRPPAESKPLADTWLKTQDTRKYAEILTRYNPNKRAEVQNVAPLDSSQNMGQMQQAPSRQENIPQQVREPASHEQIIPLISPMQGQPAGLRYGQTPDTPVISIVPNPMIPTVSWRSGSSEIMMRNFQPIIDHTPPGGKHNTDMPENLFPEPDKSVDSVSIIGLKDQKESSDNKQRDDFHKSYVPMRVWGTTARAVIADEPDDVDEDNVVYKPV